MPIHFNIGVNRVHNLFLRSDMGIDKVCEVLLCSLIVKEFKYRPDIVSVNHNIGFVHLRFVVFFHPNIINEYILIILLQVILQ